MAQPSLDDGIQKLETFISVVSATNDALQEDVSNLERQGDALEGLDDEVQDGYGGLGRELAEVKDEVDGQGGEAEGALEDLGRAAENLQQQRLSAMDAEMQAADGAFESGAEEGERDLEKSFSTLEADGFEPLHEGAEGARSDLDTAEEENAAAFAQMDDTFSAQRQELDQARSDAVEGIGEAVEAVGESAGALEADTPERLEGWTGELTQQLTALEEEVGPALETLYQDWASDLEAAAEALMQAVADLAREAAERLVDTEGAGLEEDVRDTLQALARAGEERTALHDALSKLQPAADALPALVDDLVIVEAVIESIDRLMDALGQ